MIRAVAGWMLVQPLAMRTSNDQLRLGRVHAIGQLDDEIAAKVPFAEGDRVCWIEGRGEVHILNETLLLVSLNAPLAYEPADDDVEPDENGDDDALRRIARSRRQAQSDG